MAKKSHKTCFRMAIIFSVFAFITVIGTSIANAGTKNLVEVLNKKFSLGDFPAETHAFTLDYHGGLNTTIVTNSGLKGENESCYNQAFINFQLYLNQSEIQERLKNLGVQNIVFLFDQGLNHGGVPFATLTTELDEQGFIQSRQSLLSLPIKITQLLVTVITSDETEGCVDFGYAVDKIEWALRDRECPVD